MEQEYNTPVIFTKNQTLAQTPYELCYEYKQSKDSKWARYCVINTEDGSVIMERCEGSFFDGYEYINLLAVEIDFIISVAPPEITLMRNAKGWM